VTDQLAQLRKGAIDALFFPASERELQIVLPQLEHGLPNVQMLGGESWLTDAARGVPPRVLQGAIIATPLFQESADIAWGDFVQGYEAMHRRTLTNPVPALGHDAVAIALNSLRTGDTSFGNFRGATGVLSLESGHVSRRPFLVRIDSGRLIPVN
jgi:hypothetical protein